MLEPKAGTCSVSHFRRVIFLAWQFLKEMWRKFLSWSRDTGERPMPKFGKFPSFQEVHIVRKVIFGARF